MIDLSNLTLDDKSPQELIELLDLTEHWTETSDNKFFLYTPNPIMEIFHSSTAQTRAIFGGNRSGKTYSTILEASMCFIGEAPKSIKSIIPSHRINPKNRIRVCTVDYPNNFMKVVWELIQVLIPSEFIKDVIKEQGRVKAITNHYGGFIEFMQYEQDVKKFQGSSRHLIIYDEEPPISIRDENLMRLVDTNGEEIFGLTPVSEIDKPVIWIYDELFDKAGRVVEKDYETKIIIDNINPQGNPRIEVFFANIFDNIAINKESAESILSRFPKEERLVREKGHFMMMSGRVYKEYSDTIHLIDDFDWWSKPEDVSLYIAIDPHPRTPHAALFLIVRRDGFTAIVDELFLSALPIEFIQAIKIKCRGLTPELIILDQLAWTHDPSSGRCLAYDFIDAGLNNPMPMIAPKDLSHGIIKTKEALSLNQYGKPSIYINRECTRFRYEITHYVWDSWKKDIALTKAAKQKPVDKDDHMMENFYRLILMRPEYHTFNLNEVEFESKNLTSSNRNYMTGY